MKSSATFEITDVKDIGRRCVFISVIWLALGIGEMLDCFQLDANFSCWNELFMIWKISNPDLEIH